MRQYTVHLNNLETPPDLVLIKEGFSWPGFFLTALWALWHRMWLVAAAMLVVDAVLILTASMLGLEQMAQSAVSLGFAVGVGFIANDLRRWTLERRGYVFKTVVSENSIELAERRFLDNAPELAAKLVAESP